MLYHLYRRLYEYIIICVYTISLLVFNLSKRARVRRRRRRPDVLYIFFVFRTAYEISNTFYGSEKNARVCKMVIIGRSVQ